MNEIKIFENEEMGKLRVFDQNNELWFIAKDVCSILDIKNVSQACNKLGVTEKANVYLNDTSFNGVKQNRKNLSVSESGLYKLILQSRKADAERFQDWVTSEVLPSIRKHGVYMTPETIEKTLTNPDFIIQLATQLKEEQEKTRVLGNKNNLLMHDRKSFSITEIAKELGLRSAQQLNKMLEEEEIIFKNKKGKWLPHADYSNKGYFQLKDNVINTIAVYYLKVTQQGRVFILNLFK